MGICASEEGLELLAEPDDEERCSCVSVKAWHGYCTKCGKLVRPHLLPPIDVPLLSCCHTVSLSHCPIPLSSTHRVVTVAARLLRRTLLALTRSLTHAASDCEIRPSAPPSPPHHSPIESHTRFFTQLFTHSLRSLTCQQPSHHSRTQTCIHSSLIRPTSRLFTITGSERLTAHRRWLTTQSLTALLRQLERMVQQRQVVTSMQMPTMQTGARRWCTLRSDATVCAERRIKGAKMRCGRRALLAR